MRNIDVRSACYGIGKRNTPELVNNGVRHITAATLASPNTGSKMINQTLQENRTFFNHWAKSYDAPRFQFWMRRFYRPILKEIKDTDTILDVSCGSGEFLRELHETTTAKLIGMDFSEKMVELASKKLSGKAEIIQGDVHNVSFPSESFDVVVSTEAFHHYYDQQKALQEMMRVAKKGGKIIISDIHFFLSLIHRLFEHLEPGCVKINSKEEIKRLFQQAGLTNIKQRRSFFFSIITEGVK